MKSQQEHRWACGYTCPSCGSDEIDAAGFDEDGDGGVYRKRSCGTCRTAWIDHYDLAMYSLIDPVDYYTGAKLMIDQERRAMADSAPLYALERGKGFAERARERIAFASHDLDHTAY